MGSLKLMLKARFSFKKKRKTAEIVLKCLLYRNWFRNTTSTFLKTDPNRQKIIIIIKKPHKPLGGQTWILFSVSFLSGDDETNKQVFSSFLRKIENRDAKAGVTSGLSRIN